MRNSAVKALFIMFAAALALAQTPAFEVASVRASQSRSGGDGTIVMNPGRFIARNATLKHLIFEAYRVPYSQISGGPGWIDFDEFDVEAKSAAPASPAQLRTMLKALLADRFKLTLHSVSKQSNVYVLTVGKGGSKLKTVKDGALETAPSAAFRFQCDLAEFADRLATMLTIPLSPDPTKPTMARGSPKPVLDRTGLAGIYDIAVSPRPEPGDDGFTMWQRTLQEQLGLKLDAQNAQVETLVVDRAERPLQN